MIREEAINKLTKMINLSGDLSQTDKELAFECFERLEQPPTLAEFLGWRENQEYRLKTNGKIYKVINDTLLINKSGEYRTARMRIRAENINDLRSACKIEPKKYWLVNEELDKRLFNYLNLTEGEICFASKQYNNMKH